MVTIGMIQGFQLFLLIFVRILGMMTVAPFFTSMVIPYRVKAILAVLTAVIMLPLISTMSVKPELDLVRYLMQIGGEALIGIVIGFMMAVFFTAFQFAAEMFSVQMGLSITMVFDPQAQIQISIIGQMLSMFSIMVFLALGAHHQLLNGVFYSYQTIPVLEVTGHASIFSRSITVAFTRMFGAAIMIGLPIIGTALIISVTLGILAKTAPQLNILMLGFPLQILVGMLMLVVALPLIFQFISNWITYGLDYTLRTIGVKL